MGYGFLNRQEFDQHIEDVRHLRYPTELDSEDTIEEMIWVQLTGSTLAGCAVADIYYLDLSGTPTWVSTGRQALVLKPDLTAPTTPTSPPYAAKYAGQKYDGTNYTSVYIVNL